MPSLDDINSRNVASGVPTSSDIVPFYDVSELGNNPIKRATVADLVSSGVTAEATLDALESMDGGQQADARAAIGLSSAPIDVTADPYNAVSDAQILDGAVMTSGNAALTCSGASFTADDVGKFIRVVGAGAAGADLVTTIAARSSATAITLSVAASTSVSSAQVFYGTDNTAAFQSAVDAASASSSTRTVMIPAGNYLCNLLVLPGITIQGAGCLQSQAVVSTLPSATDYTNLLPSLSSLGVLYCDSANISAGSVCIRDLNVIGGNGTLSADRLGTGIEIGPPLDSINGAVGSGWKLQRLKVNGFNRGISMSRTWDSVVESVQVDYCNTAFFGGEVTSGGTIMETGPADGITFTSCGTNYCDIVFSLAGSKQTTISGGDYNNMTTFARLSGSSVVASNLNIEQCSDVVWNLVGTTSSQVDCGRILVLSSTPDLVRNENTISHDVSIRFCSADLTYKTAAATGYPLDLPRNTTIKRYSDTAFSTLIQTEYWNNLRRQFWVRDAIFTLFEPWTKVNASPYGSLGWTATNIAGSSSFGPEANSFKIYQSAGSQAVRLMPENDTANFFTNWRMSQVFKLAANPTGTALRIGLYSRDGTAAMIPANGIGLRADSVTAGDTNAKLEVIVNSSIQTVVDTGIALSALDDVYYELVLQKQGSNLHCYLRNTNSGALAAAQVTYSGTMPTSSNYCCPGIFLSGSNAQLCYLRQMLFEQLK